MTSPPVAPGPAALAPVAPALLVRRRTSALTVVTMVVLGLGALAIAVGVLVAGGPVAGFVTTALAALSFPLLIFLCFWLDRYEPEPLRYRVAALGWGGVIAVVVGGGLTGGLAILTGSSEAVTTAVWAPLAEEFAKGAFLLLLLLVRRRQLQGLLDGIIYAVLVGIGFAFTEDVLYYLSALGEGGVPGLTVTFVLRGVISPFAHPLFTAAIGVGIGIAAAARRGPLKILAPLVGYLVAALLHGIWNGSAVYAGGSGFLLAYAVVMLPVLAGLVVLAVWARRHEGRMLASALTDCAHMGWLPLAEVPWVATLTERRRARSHAREVGGRAAVTVLTEYQQALIEMGFLHSRVLRGTARPDYRERMLAIRARADALRPYVVLPGARGAVVGPYPYGVPALPPGSGSAPAEGAQYSPIPGQPPVVYGPQPRWSTSAPPPPAPPPGVGGPPQNSPPATWPPPTWPPPQDGR